MLLCKHAFRRYGENHFLGKKACATARKGDMILAGVSPRRRARRERKCEVIEKRESGHHVKGAIGRASVDWLGLAAYDILSKNAMLQFLCLFFAIFSGDRC